MFSFCIIVTYLINDRIAHEQIIDAINYDDAVLIIANMNLGNNRHGSDKLRRHAQLCVQWRAGYRGKWTRVPLDDVGMLNSFLNNQVSAPPFEEAKRVKSV